MPATTARRKTRLKLVSVKKTTNLGRIALGRKAGGKTFDSTGIRTIDLDSNPQTVGKTFGHTGIRTITSRLITICTADWAICPLCLLCCNRVNISNKLYFGVRAIEITQK